MSNNLLLAAQKVEDGYLDCTVGEPIIVRDCLSKLVDLEHGRFELTPDMWNYPDPCGYAPLVDLLETKHQARVIITNGAKQALAAVFYALHKKGKTNLGIKPNFWALIPPLVNEYGMHCSYLDPDVAASKVNNEFGHDSFLMIAPNNPDGSCLPYDTLRQIAGEYQDNGIPFIHDSAYYTHTYLPADYELGPLGDAQIFSLAKIAGLSGLRIGYVVCYDESLIPFIKEYMEMMTVGVSSVSQHMVYNLLSWFNHHPDLAKEFYTSSYNQLTNAKKMVKEINPEILSVPSNMEEIPGMFLWAKCHKPEAFKAAKINVAPGRYFGDRNYIRMNLALREPDLREVIKRLNSV